MNRPDTSPLDLNDRILLAHTALGITWEQRDGFLSDDDVLDVCALWTTTDLDARYASDDVTWEPGDYDEMTSLMFVILSHHNDDKEESQ